MLNDPTSTLNSLRWRADQQIVNYEGEHVWLKPCLNVAGERIGITDCCFVDEPCEHHRTIEAAARRVVVCTEANVGDYYDGVVIECSDIAGTYWVPGWQCKRCGWRIGTARLPPPHTCPDQTQRR